MVKWGMVIDRDRCIGCQACTLACKEENTLPDGVFWNDVIFKVEGKYPSVSAEWYPRPCMHCENPACVKACPTEARYKRSDGLVLTNWDKCIGSRYCIAACPYGVNYYDRKPILKPSIIEVFGKEPVYRIPEGDTKRGFGIPPPKVVEKCTFCAHRIDKGLAKGLKPGEDTEATPACVEACPARARIFGDLDDTSSKISKLIAERRGFQLKSEFGTRPQVYYLPAWKGR